MTTMYFREKKCMYGASYTLSDSMSFYNLARRVGCDHDEAANFQGWSELAGPGEVYDCQEFYAEIEG